ncbi:MAG: hypothetical protein LBJ64_00785 [Deltaproteobacteria bacterium]|nr:hypothetical protein [Deltaproteobacteria bacterium]
MKERLPFCLTLTMVFLFVVAVGLGGLVFWFEPTFELAVAAPEARPPAQTETRPLARSAARPEARSETGPRAMMTASTASSKDSSNSADGSDIVFDSTSISPEAASVRLTGSLEPPEAPRLLTKEELAPFLSPADFFSTSGEDFQINGPDGEILTVKTALDPDLQAQVRKWIRGAGARKAALVVLNPQTGRILAMAGTEARTGNAVLDSSFPAASVFKMVTASAVLEKTDYTVMTPFAYDGDKHTLYRNNVFKEVDQGVNEATLKESFAESINAVFGKLGAFSLPPEDLAEMARNFGFNEEIAFELPLAVSSFDLDLATYGEGEPIEDDLAFDFDSADYSGRGGQSADSLWSSETGLRFKPLQAKNENPSVGPGQIAALQAKKPVGASLGETELDEAEFSESPYGGLKAGDRQAGGTNVDGTKIDASDSFSAVESLAAAAKAREEAELADAYRLAELASGFNRQTRLSPLHGALMASVAVNGGLVYEPFVIREVLGMDGGAVYKGRPSIAGQAVSPETAQSLAELMQAAIDQGTGRKQFSDAQYHPLLSKLVLGGKSGTINDDDGLKVDWFVAFAKPKPETAAESGTEVGELALAAVVVHDGKYRVASQELIRRALLAYYQPRLLEESLTRKAETAKGSNKS